MKQHNVSKRNGPRPIFQTKDRDGKVVKVFAFALFREPLLLNQIYLTPLNLKIILKIRGQIHEYIKCYTFSRLTYGCLSEHLQTVM